MERLMTIAHWPLRVALALLLAGATVLQTLSFPGQFRHLEHKGDITSGERWLATAVVGYELLCVQVVLVAIWVLLGRVRKHQIFEESSFQWVDAIIAAIIAAGLGPAGILIALFGFGQPDDPGLPFLVFLLGLGCAVLALLMLVMRSLLRQATTLRTDLDEVI